MFRCAGQAGGGPLMSNVRLHMVTPAHPVESKAASYPAGANDIEKPTQHVVDVAKIGLATTGAALVAYLAYRWARRKDDRTNFIDAGARFREAFAADLAAIENGNIGYRGIVDFLIGAYNERHAAAVVIFEPFVPTKKLAAFRDDWNRYRYGQDKDGRPNVPAEDGLPHDELLFLCYSEAGVVWESHTGMPAGSKAIARIKRLCTYTSEA
jgi:hypothetical protein